MLAGEATEGEGVTVRLDELGLELRAAGDLLGAVNIAEGGEQAHGLSRFCCKPSRVGHQVAEYRSVAVIPWTLKVLVADRF